MSNRTDDLLERMCNLIASRGGGFDRAPAQLTQVRGVELPLVMADPIFPAKNLVGASDWAGIANQDIHHYTLGEVLVQANVVKPTALFSYAAEVQIIASIQGSADLLAVGVVNNTTGPFRVLLPLGSAFQSIIVQARQLVNGASSALNANDASMAGAVLEVTTKMRLYR
jgi:hypothetical protein